jgi:hypothetical protein
MPKISVRYGDVLSVEADVLALKYAQQPFGVDALVLGKLLEHRRELVPPKPWEFCLIQGVPEIAARSILLVGVPPLHQFMYREIREFARRVLSNLAGQAPSTKSIAMTLHGAGYGLDEAEAFESEVAGLLDAYNDSDIPEALTHIVIVERNRGRATRLTALLADLAPAGELTSSRWGAVTDAQPRSLQERLRAAGYASEGKAHVFVAMPFSDDMDNVYHYGIESAAKAAGFLCERADLSSFTGDVMEWVKSRIKSASVVVADLTEANPNVYLEVGYAWGCGVKTVLIVKSTVELRFDVKTQRCLVYKKIQELEEALSKELKSLRADGAV